jgi:hypothetical protein
MVNSESNGFSVYVDLRQVDGTVSVAIDQNGDGTISVAFDIPPTTVSTWYMESSTTPTEGPTAVQLSATNVTAP